MFHIGIATKHPPLPEKGELSDLGIEFVRACLNIDPLKRPSASEMMEHPWIQAFSQEIANEMQMHENGGEDEEQYPAEQEYEEHEGEGEYAEAGTPGGYDQYEEGAFEDDAGELPPVAARPEDMPGQD